MAVGAGAFRRVVHGLALLGGLTTMLGCSTPNPSVRAREFPDGRLQVAGPLAGPFRSLAELAENACDLMTGQPGAASGQYGMEYCALHYFVATESAYYLSYLSAKGGTRINGDKFCELPSMLDDPSHPDAVILGGDHSHPHNREFSRRDLSARTIRFPTRIVDQRTGQILHRQLLLFYREKAGQCRSYAFDHVTRTVSALRKGAWVPIGDVLTDGGIIQLRDGQDWVP
jgi:hypothetical protein